MLRNRVFKISCFLLSTMLLLGLLLSGCDLFKDANKNTSTNIYESPYLKIDLLTDIQEKTGVHILNAVYTCPVYRYTMNFPGLVRVDNYGMETIGRTAGTLQCMILDTVAGNIQIFHPQENYPYKLVSSKSVLDANGQPLIDQTDVTSLPSNDENETDELDELTADQDEAEDSLYPEEPEIIYNFKQNEFKNGKSLFEDFFIKLDVQAEFDIEPNDFFVGDQLVGQEETYGDYRWYHVTVSNDGKIKQHFFTGIIKDTPMIISVEAGNFEDYYDRFEYVPLAEFASQMNERQPEILQGILKSLQFHDDLADVLKQMDAGLLTIDSRGGDLLSRAEAILLPYEETDFGLSEVENNLPNGQLIINTSRSATVVEGYYTDAIFRQTLPQPNTGTQTTHWSTDPLISELEQVIRLSQLTVDNEAEALESNDTSITDWQTSELTIEGLEPFIWDHKRLGIVQGQVHIIRPNAEVSEYETESILDEPPNETGDILTDSTEFAENNEVPSMDESEVTDSEQLNNINSSLTVNIEQEMVEENLLVLAFHTPEYEGLLIDKGIPRPVFKKSTNLDSDSSDLDTRINGLLFAFRSMLPTGTAASDFKPWSFNDYSDSETAGQTLPLVNENSTGRHTLSQESKSEVEEVTVTDLSSETAATISTTPPSVQGIATTSGGE